MILVTGAAGFIGQHIVDRLSDDHDVRGMVYSDDDIETVEALGAEAVVGDVTDPASLDDAVEDVDTIIHLVAIIDGTPDQFQEIHVQGTQNLLDAAPDDLDRFIYFSALGAEKESTDYFTTKREAERRVKDAGLPYTIFRPSVVFGDNDGFINLLIDQYEQYPVMPVLGDGSYRLQPIHVDDVAAIVEEALDSEECIDQLFEIGGPGIMTLEQIIDLIMDEHGKRKMKVYVPLGLAKLGAPFARRIMDVPLSNTTLTMLKQENYVKEKHYTDVFDVKLHSLDDLFSDIYLD